MARGLGLVLALGLGACGSAGPMRPDLDELAPDRIAQRVIDARSGRVLSADALLARLGVAHLADRLLTQMSSGEVRRVVIARALVHDPSSLVLDEPTNSLDLRAMRDLRGAVRTIAQSGLSVVMVTHHLADIIPEIARVILIKRGRVVDDGPKDALLTSARLTDLFEMPIEVVRRGDFYHAW